MFMCVMYGTINFVFHNISAAYQSILLRNNRLQIVYKKVIIKISQGIYKFQRNILVPEYLAGWNPVILLKKRLLYRCFPVNFAKFLRTPFLHNTFALLLLSTQGNLKSNFGLLL